LHHHSQKNLSTRRRIRRYHFQAVVWNCQILIQIAESQLFTSLWNWYHHQRLSGMKLIQISAFSASYPSITPCFTAGKQIGVLDCNATCWHWNTIIFTSIIFILTIQARAYCWSKVWDELSPYVSLDQWFWCFYWNLAYKSIMPFIWFFFKSINTNNLLLSRTIYLDTSNNKDCGHMFEWWVFKYRDRVPETGKTGFGSLAPIGNKTYTLILQIEVFYYRGPLSLLSAYLPWLFFVGEHLLMPWWSSSCNHLVRGVPSRWAPAPLIAHFCFLNQVSGCQRAFIAERCTYIPSGQHAPARSFPYY
jgi:hypothetical protein